MLIQAQFVNCAVFAENFSAQTAKFSVDVSFLQDEHTCKDVNCLRKDTVLRHTPSLGGFFDAKEHLIVSRILPDRPVFVGGDNGHRPLLLPARAP